MSTDGETMLALAKTRCGEKYVNVCVPKNNPNWHGPWDCAEFMSWLVYQIGHFLYGCVNDDGDPATTEAYTGAWQSDANKKGKKIDWAIAAGIPGAILLRYPPAPGSMGHIVVSDGTGGTVEAMGKKWGVTTGHVSGRLWHTGVLLPGFTYPDGAAIEAKPPVTLYGIGCAGMKKEIVKAIQAALGAAGIDPGPIDGDFGPNTTTAVAAFQATKGLVVDGMVGSQTARALKVALR